MNELRRKRRSVRNNNTDYIVKSTKSGMCVSLIKISLSSLKRTAGLRESSAVCPG